MLDALGGDGSKLWTQVKHLLPKSATGLVDGSLYSPLSVNKSRLCKVAPKVLSTNNIEQFRLLSSPSLLSDDGSLTPADVIQANSHSFAGRIFASSLKQSVPFAFSPSSYIAWCLFFVGLRPTSTLYNHEVQEGFDYPVQRCLSKHGVYTVPFLDAGGCHASSGCPSTIGTRYKNRPPPFMYTLYVRQHVPVYTNLCTHCVHNVHLEVHDFFGGCSEGVLIFCSTNHFFDQNFGF